MTKKSPEQRIQRIEDIREIKNLVANYSLYYAAGAFGKLELMFAQKTPGVRITMADWGSWEGPEGIKRFYSGLLNHLRGDGVGVMAQNYAVTPVIEIAGDGRTAKAVWVYPGVFVTRDGENEPRAVWNWAKAAQDLVKEDGEWRFWHFHVYEVLQAPFETGWAEVIPPAAPEIPEKFKPDVSDTIDYPYSESSGPVYIPAPPEPYETFDERTAY